MLVTKTSLPLLFFIHNPHTLKIADFLNACKLMNRNFKCGSDFILYLGHSKSHHRYQE